MGLSDRKVKQKIQADPRNLQWKNDASRFGHAYLSKLGWSTGSTLGLTGQGLTDYIRVAHKLDALGIGAAVGGREDRDGRAGREFDGLLRRLNADEGEEVKVEETIKVSGFHRANGEEGVSVEDTIVVQEKGKKRKRSPSSSSSSSTPEETVTTTTVTTVSTSSTPASAIPRRLAHRSRFLRAKSLAKSDSRAMSEILGIASAPASLPGTPGREGSPVPLGFPSLSSTGRSTPQSQDPEERAAKEEEEEDLKVSTSALSVADYFKQKMRAKLGLATPSTSTSEPASPATLAEEDRQGMGLGFGSARGLGFRAAPPVQEADTGASSEPADVLPAAEEKPTKKAEKEKRRPVESGVPLPAAKEKPKKAAKKENAESGVPLPELARERSADLGLGVDPERKKKKGRTALAEDAAPSAVDATPPAPAPADVVSDSKQKEKKDRRKKRKLEAEPAALSEPARKDGEKRKKKKRKTGDA
ncbi:hypothetical protein CALVIDRAFT_600409 [Calocera viscosa TUFC12733]|uniref:PinX1-related protein 1 n=1 Tax=Calocera viscosa (strain TUFC12733) TaxID=1330018 RepID=A0A167JV02_CALVF|nr:hypothetical protein CALVIDRAFT_600409 [Calocera viscosa TUFC12733]